MKSKKATRSWLLLPVGLAVCLTPLLARLHVQSLRITTSPSFAGLASHAELESWIRALTTIVAAGLGVLFLFKATKKESLLANATALAALSYLLIAALAATFLTPHHEIVWLGFPGHNQGALVWVSYFALFLVGMHLTGSRQVTGLLVLLVLVGLAVTLIAWCEQTYGHPYGLEPFKSWIMGSYEGVDVARKSSSKLAATLSNPNYLGIYGAYLATLSLGVILSVPTLWIRLIMLPLHGGSIFLLLKSQSISGLLAWLAGLVMITLLAWPQIKNRRTAPFWLFLGYLGLVVVGSSLFGLNRAWNRVSTVRAWDAPQEEPIKRIDLASPQRLVFATREATLLIEAAEQRILFSGADGWPLPINKDGDVLEFATPAYQSFHVRKVEDYPFPSFALSYLEQSLVVGLTPKGLRILDKNMWLIPENPERLPDLNDRWLSRRGYIWSRTIPPLRDNIALGNGPDTFPLTFPQRDYAGRLNHFYGDPLLQTVSKSHNLYLQLGHHFGLLSLIPFLILTVGLCFRVWKRTRNPASWDRPVCVATAIAAATACFLVAGLTNDLVVSLGPTFWTLLGVGWGNSRSPAS